MINAKIKEMAKTISVLKVDIALFHKLLMFNNYPSDESAWAGEVHKYFFVILI